MGYGNKAEGKVPDYGQSQNEAMITETAGQCNGNGPTKESMKKVDLRSGGHGVAKEFPKT